MPIYFYGIKDAKIAPLNPDGSYAAAVTIQLQTVELNYVTESQEAVALNRTIDVAGNFTEATVTGSYYFDDLKIMDIFTAGTFSTGATYSKFKLTSDCYPEFGLIFSGAASTCDGFVGVFIPRLKLTGNLTMPFADNTYLIQQFNASSVGDYTPNPRHVVMRVQDTNGPSLVIPPNW